MKRILLILGVLLLAPLSVFAARIVDLQGDITVPLTIGGTSFNFTVKSGSGYQSMTVDATSVTFDLIEGDAVTVTSADRKVLTNTPYGHQTSCEASLSSVILKLPGGIASQTLTLAPSSDTCGSGGGGAPGSTGGGGGGGSGYVEPAPTPTPPAAPALPTPPAQLPSRAKAALVSPVFNRTLAVGSKGEDVTRLQTLLKSDPELYPEGLVSGYYGSLTVKAVQRFQAKYRLISSGTPRTTGYGLVGPKTRAKLSEVFGGKVTAPATPTPAAPAAPVAPAVSDLQAQIQQLLQQINALKAQINVSQQAPAPTPAPAPAPVTQEPAPSLFPKLFGIPQIGQ